MADDWIVPVAEMERMSPAERLQLLRDRAVTDPSQLDADLLAAATDGARAAYEEHAASQHKRA